MSTDKDVQVQRETKETPESHLLLVHIPDGFAKEHIGAKVEYDFGRVRVYGERPLGNNKFSRFDERYKVPAHCDINRIKGKFEGKTITIIMPKIPGLVPEPTEQEPPKPAVQETQPNQGNDKEETPQESATGDDKEKATASEVKDQKGAQEETSSDKNPKSTNEGKEKVGDHEPSTSTPTPPEGTKESLPQEGTQEAETPHNATATRDAKFQTEEKSADENKEKEKVGKEETEESLPQKGTQEATPQNATVTRDAKLQTEEKSADEKSKEKEKFGKEETQDHPSEKTAESGKPPEEKAVVTDSSPTLEKEGKEESKGSAMVERFLPKNTEKVNGKEVNGKFGDGDADAETKSDKKAMVESTTTTRTTIKEKASSAYQALTSLTNRFNEEDKQKLIYMGAAVVVLTLGVYASFKFRSSRRT